MPLYRQHDSSLIKIYKKTNFLQGEIELKFKSRLLTILITLGFLFTLVITNNDKLSADTRINESKGVEHTDITFKNLKTSGHWNTGPIFISFDNWTEFDHEWIQVNDGTPQNPHIIENVTINAGGSGSGIKIQSSHEYFIIRNCTVYNTGSDFEDAGIKLHNTKNGLIINNTVSNLIHGIYLRSSCENNNITGNIANDNTCPDRHQQ